MPTRSRQKLLICFKRLLADKRFNDPARWQEVRVGHSITFYVTGGPAGNVALLAEVHNWEIFAEDGVDMHPDDVRNVSTVGEYFDAIKNWYRANGWTLTT